MQHALAGIADDAAIARHLDEFTTRGFTVIPGARDARWVAQVRERFEAIRARQPTTGPDKPLWLEDIIESEPDIGLEAIANPRVLAVAEAIIGPHVQVESMTLAGFPPAPPGSAPGPEVVHGWHRDLYAHFPADGVYQRPLLFNAMTYLQDLTDANGPLRVIPGSHRRAIGVTAEEKPRRHTEELVLYPKAGDTVLFHNALLHTGAPNRSDDMRFFFCVAYNHCWLRQRANFSGPVCQGIIRLARARGDRRLLRLLGADDQVIMRALHDHVLEPEAGTWSRWIGEERAAVRAPA